MEDGIDRAERKIKNVEEAILVLTELTVQHSSLLEKPVFDTEELKAGQREMQEKINILIDAQIRSDDKMAELADTIKLAHQRIDKIEGN